MRAPICQSIAQHENSVHRARSQIFMLGGRHLISSHTRLSFQGMTTRQEIGKAPTSHFLHAFFRQCNSPYDTSTTAIITACNRWSNMSDCESSVLKSADPASTSPATFGLSLVMKN